MTKSKMPDRLKPLFQRVTFNDGMGIVLFVSFSEVASIPDKNFSFTEALKLFGHEAFGGMLRLIVYRMMRAISGFQTIVMLSLTLALSIAAIVGLFHVSTPLAIVAVGPLIGIHSFKRNESIAEGENLEKVWALADELLNSILFVLIWLQLVTINVRLDLLIGGTAV